ncbi:uncharacterized protein LOC132701283 [Cylas formicarius]|uniref:uncharacterized protein LOC132701283 n=1 Tax=Cylas formicarius TaxID=197179 RepID=UPI0029585191|nr:uncharacterized protein LOC132701283 [Cylas formicarius]
MARVLVLVLLLAHLSFRAIAAPCLLCGDIVGGAYESDEEDEDDDATEAPDAIKVALSGTINQFGPVPQIGAIPVRLMGTLEGVPASFLDTPLEISASLSRNGAPPSGQSPAAAPPQPVQPPQPPQTVTQPETEEQ